MDFTHRCSSPLLQIINRFKDPRISRLVLRRRLALLNFLAELVQQHCAWLQVFCGDFDQHLSDICKETEVGPNKNRGVEDGLAGYVD